MSRFNHNAGTVEEALGITEERKKEILKLIDSWINKYKTVSEILEEIMNSKDLNDVEKIYTAYVLAGKILVARLFGG